MKAKKLISIFMVVALIFAMYTVNASAAVTILKNEYASDAPSEYYIRYRVGHEEKNYAYAYTMFGISNYYAVQDTTGYAYARLAVFYENGDYLAGEDTSNEISLNKNGAGDHAYINFDVSDMYIVTEAQSTHRVYIDGERIDSKTFTYYLGDNQE